MQTIKIKDLKKGDIIDTHKRTGYTFPCIGMVLSVSDRSNRSSWCLQTQIMTISIMSERGIANIAFLENDTIEVIRRMDEKESNC